MGEQSIIPHKNRFHVGQYEDSGEPKLVVQYDYDGWPCQDSIWINPNQEQWVAFDYRDAEALCEAIMSAAQAIHQLSMKEQNP